MSDYYEILGVNRKASLTEIKKVYRKLARKFHPDLNPGDKIAEQKFKEINQAYEILKDPEKRKQYDTFGTVGDHYNRKKGFGDFEGFDFTTTGTSSFGDIFETIFGGGGRYQPQTRTKDPTQGEDLRYAMNLSFMDAAHGLETPIQIVRKEQCSSCSGKGVEPNSPKSPCSMCKGSGRIQKQTGFMKFASNCPNCSGSGHLPGKNCGTCYGEGRIDKVTRIKAMIPPGVDDDSRIRLPGKGNAGRFGGPAGDLIISINVSPHKFFKRIGLNLAITLPITFLESALGAKIEVPTLDGKTLLKIPPNTRSGQKLRLKNKGFNNPRNQSKGDMIIEIAIIPPPTQDIEVREMLKKIEEKAPYNPREELEI